jgi:type IV pilus assembly protein PilP
MGVLIIALLLLWIAGCGEGGPTVPVPGKGMAPVAKKKEAPPVSATTQVSKAETEYTYNPAGKPDPFKPFIQLTSVRRNGPPLTPLQRYDLSQLKLVAIIASPEGNVGLVEDSAGKGFFLKKGTLIGKNDGKVSRILKDRVIIEELFQDIYGKAKNSEVSLYLYRPEEEGTEQ